MEKLSEPTYAIPARYRKMENMHIVFWLFKDIGWCMGWKTPGMLMILPTLAIALMISWRTREIKAELAHNLAVTFWITANSYWMISEFFGFDGKVIYQGVEGKYMAMVPFSMGVLILAYYYLIQKSKESDSEDVATR